MSKLIDTTKKKTLCTRLARVEGQLRGVQRLIELDADCEEVAQQLSAARKALDKQGNFPADKVAGLLAKFA
jgi:CsoR family transcriptional regulator, copper-sensing transcriptional repressor